MTNDVSVYVSSGEAAELIGVSPDTIRRYARLGLLPSFPLPSGQLRFRTADVLAVSKRPTGGSLS